MLINIIGFGSFLYLIGSYMGCSRNFRTKTRINSEFLSIGGCPYNQLDKDPKMIPMSSKKWQFHRKVVAVRCNLAKSLTG